MPIVRVTVPESLRIEGFSLADSIKQRLGLPTHKQQRGISRQLAYYRRQKKTAKVG